jgi:hypothetical protein
MSDSDKNLDLGETPADETPEIDAEIVEDGYASTRPEPADAPVRPRPRLSDKTRKILYIAAPAIAAIAAAIVLVVSGGKPKAVREAVPEPASESANELPSTAQEGPVVAPKEPLTLEITPPAEDSGAGSEAPVKKIFNNGLIDAKDAFDALSEAAEDGDGDYLGLPPAPAADTFGNNGLQQAAKDAAKLLTAEPEGLDAPQSDFLPAPDLSTPDDVEGASDPSPGADQRSEAPGVQPVLNAAVTPETSSATNQIAAEISSLKDSLQVQVDTLNSALTRERQISQTQSSEIARLNAELATANAQAAPMAKRAMSALALTSLREKALSGAPFLDELESAREAGVTAAVIADLARFAESGLPTIAELKSEFATVRRAALAAGRREEATGPVSRLAANLSTFVSVRPANPVAGDGAVAIISRAEHRIDADDIAGAAAELATLKGDARARYDEWIARAQTRLAAEAKLSQANETMMGRIADGTFIQ